MKTKMKRIFGSMTARILAVVFVGILCAILAISTIIINLSEDIFISTYGKSQEQVFTRIEAELNEFHDDLMKITDAINSSWYLKLYLQNYTDDPRLSFQTAYKAQQDMEKAIPSDIENVSIMAVSTEGGSYLNKAETMAVSTEEILNSPEAVYAMENPGTASYVYRNTGYTSTTRNSPVIMLVRALTSPGDGNAYGVVFVTIKERDLTRYYEYFTSENSEFYLVDSQGMIVSSSEKTKLNTEMKEDFSDLHTVLKKELPDYQMTAYGIIDNKKALGNLYNVPQLWIVCMAILAVTAMIIILLVRQTTKPLSNLVEKISNARTTRFNEHIIPRGSREVKELTVTYNSMLDDLNRYIDEMMSIQKQKRKAEISALQMQINPHYIYNTLASIKWLIFQGDTEKSTVTIDAFISLLRNTITNTEEYIRVEQEIENLKNYVLINNTRYGDKVQVEYFVSFGCEECRIPKMILQPFVENAFFHAFPYEQSGKIQIFVRILEGNLQIQIIDDGVGMTQERLRELTEKNIKREHFSGIGINNVDDRLKLIYGNEYGINIQSEENKGTTITISIPVQKDEIKDEVRE